MEVQSNLKKIQELYKEYKINKKNIDDNWISFFDDLNEEAADLLEGNSNHIISNKGQSSNKNSQDNEYTANSLRARLLIRAYRIAGHLKADLDPLHLTEQKYIPDLDPKTYGIEASDMDKEVFVDGVFGINTISIRELIKVLYFLPDKPGNFKIHSSIVLFFSSDSKVDSLIFLKSSSF